MYRIATLNRKILSSFDSKMVTFALRATIATVAGALRYGTMCVVFLWSVSSPQPLLLLVTAMKRIHSPLPSLFTTWSYRLGNIYSSFIPTKLHLLSDSFTNEVHFLIQADTYTIEDSENYTICEAKVGDLLQAGGIQPTSGKLLKRRWRWRGSTSTL